MTRPKVPDEKRQRTAQACDSCKRRKQKVRSLSSNTSIFPSVSASLSHHSASYGFSLAACALTPVFLVPLQYWASVAYKTCQLLGKHSVNVALLHTFNPVNSWALHAGLYVKPCLLSTLGLRRVWPHCWRSAGIGNLLQAPYPRQCRHVQAAG